MSSSEEDNIEEMTPADVDDEDEVVVNAQSEEDDDSEDDTGNHNGDEAASPVPFAKRQKISPLGDAKQTPVDDEDDEDEDLEEEDDDDDDELAEGDKKVVEDAKEGEDEELITPIKKRGRRGRGSVSPRKDKELLSAAKGLTIPFRAVKRIMKVDKDIATVQNEAAMVASYAVELFIQNLAKDSYEHAKHRGRNTIR
jgi:histone H3/H4